MRKKALAAVLAACLCAGALAGCGSNEPKRSDAPAPESSASAAASSGTVSNDAPQKTKLESNVTLSDLSFEKVKMWNPYEDSPNVGEAYTYMIRFTADNKNDMSVDVFPSFEMTVTVPDSYGTTTTETVVVGGNASNTDRFIDTPCGILSKTDKDKISAAYAAPMGLAPGEKKSVVYYFRYYQPSTMSAMKVYESPDAKVDEDFVKYFDIPQDKQNVKYLDVSSMKIVDYLVQEASMVYVTPAECDAICQANGYDAVGSVTNNTDQRWKSGQINVANVGPGADWMPAYFGGIAKIKFDHIGVGETYDFSSNLIHNEKDHPDPTINPQITLIAYEADPR